MSLLPEPISDEEVAQEYERICALRHQLASLRLKVAHDHAVGRVDELDSHGVAALTREIRDSRQKLRDRILFDPQSSPKKDKIVMKIHYSLAESDDAFLLGLGRARTLDEIDLGKGGLTSAGMEILQSYSQLKKLQIRELTAEMSEYELASLLANFPLLESLSLSASFEDIPITVSDVLFRVIADIEGLRHLSIANMSDIADTYFEALEQLTQIESLDIMSVLGETLPFSSLRLRNLRKLDVDCSAISDEDVSDIVLNNPGIQKVSFAEAYELTDAALEALSGLANLVSVTVYCGSARQTHFTDTGLQVFASKALQYLNISGCSGITPDGVRQLMAACPTLQTVVTTDSDWEEVSYDRSILQE